MEKSPRPRMHALAARLKARISAVEAFRRAAEQYDMLNDQSYGYASTLSRQDSLLRCLSGTTSLQDRPGAAPPPPKAHPPINGVIPMPITAAEEAFSKRVATAPRRTARRGLLAEPPPFTRTSRGVVVRGGGHSGRNEYAELKTADLRSAYALYLLETDLNHYRHLYFENQRKQHVEGRLKYFSPPLCKTGVPSLWLEEPWTAVENLRKAYSDADESIAAELNSLPALRQRFARVRKQEIDSVRVKPRAPAGDAGVLGAKPLAEKRSPGSAAGKETPTASKMPAEQKAEAPASRPPPPPPGKAAPKPPLPKKAP